MEVAGGLLIAVGIILALVGGIQFLVAAFRTSVWWGLGVLFVPFVAFIFLIVRFEAAWPATKKCLLGTAISIAGIFLTGGAR